MVDVGHKQVTERVAEAECYVTCSDHLLRLLATRALAKGDPLAVAEVAGALAAKRAWELIPLCHTLSLDCVRVRAQLPSGGGPRRIHITCEVRCQGRTGAEMEALTGCAVAALTVYDMCKAADRGLVISGLRLLRKSGGSSGAPSPPPTSPRPPRHEPLAETYVPTNLAYF